MKTLKRICIKDYVCCYGEKSLKLERGKEYLTSEVNESPSIGPSPEIDHVIVFSDYWAAVPVDVFAGEKVNEFYNEGEGRCQTE